MSCFIFFSFVEGDTSLISPAAAGAESQGLSNNSQNSADSDLVAVCEGKQLRVRLTSHHQHLSLNSLDGSSSTHGSDSGSDDDSDSGSDDEFVPTASTRRGRGRIPQPAKRRGDGPKGDWRARAREVDWTSSASIEALIPPYSGDRGGKEAFPLNRLLDARGRVNPDPIWCYNRVSDWRRLTQSAQEEVVEFERNLDKVIKKKHKMMEAKRRRDEEKARKAADKAARKAATDARRNENRRAKRIREREEAAAEAGEDNRGGLDEEPINSRLLDASQAAQQSASAQVINKRSVRRSVTEPITKIAHLNDRTSRRARSLLCNTFQKTTQTLTVAPEVNATNFPQEHLMLVHVSENNSRSSRNIMFTTSSGGESIADTVFMDMLNSGRFSATLQQWHQSQGLVAQPIENTTTNSAAQNRPAAAGVVGVAAAPTRVVDVTAQTSSATESFDFEESGDDEFPILGLSQSENNVEIPADNILDHYNFAQD